MFKKKVFKKTLTAAGVKIVVSFSLVSDKNENFKY